MNTRLCISCLVTMFALCALVACGGATSNDDPTSGGAPPSGAPTATTVVPRVGSVAAIRIFDRTADERRVIAVNEPTKLAAIVSLLDLGSADETSETSEMHECGSKLDIDFFDARGVTGKLRITCARVGARLVGSLATSAGRYRVELPPNIIDELVAVAPDPNVLAGYLFDIGWVMLVRADGVAKDVMKEVWASPNLDLLVNSLGLASSLDTTAPKHKCASGYAARFYRGSERNAAPVATVYLACGSEGAEHERAWLDVTGASGGEIAIDSRVIVGLLESP